MRYSSLRFIVGYISLFLAGLCSLAIVVLVPPSQLQIIRLDQTFAFLSLIYLYLALIISPLFAVFPHLPWHKQIVQSRRSIGIFSFIFALTHAFFAFFGQLHGFAGLTFLTGDYLISLILGFVALEIMLILALTSFDKAVEYLSFSRWKFIHRFVYLAGLLVLIHTVLLGTHYLNLGGFISQLTFLLVALLLMGEAIRFDRYLAKKKYITFKFGISVTGVILLVLVYMLAVYAPSAPISLGIHAQHLQLAQLAQNSALPGNTQTIPGLSGDPHLRYTVSLNHDTIQAGQPTTLNFTIYNASNGDHIKLFSLVYTKLIHLIIVNESLTYFQHLHPTQTDDGFQITTTFPTDGRYHLYIDFQPFGAIEQQMAFTVEVGNLEALPKSTQPPDTHLTKQFGNYLVSLSYPQPLQASQLSLGQQQLTFTLKDAQTKQPVTDLKPYLAAFGHLSMINEATFDFIHVHPSTITPPTPNSNGGPTVTFLPLGLYGPIKPGTYRVYAEFNPNNSLLKTEFTIRIDK